MGERQQGPVAGDVVEGGMTHAYGWEWSDMGGPRGRTRLPWFGIFLLAFGGLLLLRRVYPTLDQAGSLLFLAAGLAFLVSWLVNRGVASLYLGSIITALAAPDLLAAANVVSGAGVGTLCLGVAFLFIALVRAASRSGWGWQAVLGAILFVIGGSAVALPEMSDLVLPAALVALGVIVIVRGATSRR